MQPENIIRMMGKLGRAEVIQQTLYIGRDWTSAENYVSAGHLVGLGRHKKWVLFQQN